MTHSLLRLAIALPLTLAVAALAFTGCAQHTVSTQPAAISPPVAPVAQKTVAGRWTAQFDTQLGIQTYTFDFKLTGNTLSGTAVGQTADQAARASIVLSECTLTSNAIHFVETRDNNGTPLRI